MDVTHHRRDQRPARIAWKLTLFYGVALVNIGTTLLPIFPFRYHLLRLALPLPLIFTAQSLTLFLGVSMLLLAYPAASGHRQAAHLLMSCLGLAALANLVKGLDVEEALVNLLALAALWRARRTLHAIPMRYTLVDVARIGLLLAIITRLYTALGHVTLHALRTLERWSDSKFPHPAQYGQVAHAAHLLTAKLDLQRLWFYQSQLLLPVFLVGVFLVFSWTCLTRYRGAQADSAALYERFGRASHNSLAYLARRDDVLTFVDPEGRGAISYRQVGRVAVQVGAILAPAEAQAAVYAAFCVFCRRQGLLPSAVALTAEERAIAHAQGMKTFSIGTEAVVDLADFAIEKLNKKMRWAQRSLAKRGYAVALLSAAEISAPQRVALDAIDAEWRAARGGQTHGCCMTLGRFPRRDDADCLIAIASDEAGAPIGYLTLLPGGEGYYSLDLTRRSHAAPNATMEFLMMETLRHLRERDARSVSLNFSTFSSLNGLPYGQKLLDLMGQAFQLNSLEAFNNKFRPSWEPRYAAIPSWYHLPDALYAALVIEGVDHMLLNAATRALRGWLSGEPSTQRLSPEPQPHSA